jgi:RNA polymerase sigma factor (sigma-70 family)
VDPGRVWARAWPLAWYGGTQVMHAPDSGLPCPGFDLDLEVRRAYLQHARAVHRHAARAALGDYQRAEDATQEAFTEAVRIWPDFRKKTPEQQLAWLSARARWRVIDGWRAACAVLPVDTLPEELTPETAEDAAISAVALDRFWKVVTTMPQRAARSAYLRWHEDWTIARVSAYLGVDRATVYRDLSAVAAAACEQLADDPGFLGPGNERGNDNAP